MNGRFQNFPAYIASFLAVCILFLLLEGAAAIFFPKNDRLERIFSILEQDPELFWKQKANLNLLFEGVNVRTNSLGLRNKEIQFEKKEKLVRIVCLGASPTFGWGVSQEQTYAAQLERLLRQKFGSQRDIEVINAGNIGYSSYQGLRFLKKDIIKYSPDVITVSYVINDVDKHRFYRSSGKSDKELGGGSKILVAVENLLNNWNIVRVLRKLFFAFQSGAVQYFGEIGRGEYTENRRVSLKDYRENLRDIIHAARQNHINIILVKMPVNLPAPAVVAESSQFKADNNIKKAILLSKEYRYEQAIEELKESLKYNSYSREAFFYLGKYYEQLGRFAEARESFKKAVIMELYECGRLGKIYNQYMQEVADKEKVLLVDIVAEFDEFKKKNHETIFQEDKADTIHPNGIGHALISQAIYKAIINNSLIQ